MNTFIKSFGDIREKRSGWFGLNLLLAVLIAYTIVSISGWFFVSFRLKMLEDRFVVWEQQLGITNASSWVKAKASTFGRGDDLIGKHMYTGVKLNDKDLFFASRDIPMGTKVHFYYPKSGKHAVGVCMDWGPAEWTGRIIDLGPALCDRLAFRGVDFVQMRILD